MKWLCLAVPAILGGCTQAPLRQSDIPHPVVVAASPVVNGSKDAPYPEIELNGRMLYMFLLADIAAQRGHAEMAVQAYLDLAQETRDVRVVRRAAQLAYEAHQSEAAREALRLWRELEPQAALPRQLMVTSLLNEGKLKQATSYLSEMLAADSANAGRIFAQMYPLLPRLEDREGVYQMVRQLAEPYPSVAEARWVLAQSADATARVDEALLEATKAYKLRPEWPAAVMLVARLQQARASAESLTLLKEYLQRQPEAGDVRLMYARALLDRKQYRESREQFSQLSARQPENAEIAFAIALISIQMGEVDQAETQLKRMLGTKGKQGATLHYYLGQIEEARKNASRAMQEYQLVTSGEYVVPARIRIAFLLFKQGKEKEARSLLQQTEANNKTQQIQLVLTEAQMLRDAKKYDEAARVLTKGLSRFPDNGDMLYESAMIADRQGKLEMVEQMLRKLIQLEPGHAHAYNALGYALMERGVRLEEALQMAEKAHRLAPEDPAIMDSVGWGYYLLGKLEKSADFLRRAYAANPDPEIAAHLGEVLWKQEERDEAKKVWLESLKSNPDHPALKAVIKKFVP